MTGSCYKKCITVYKTTELETGELACIDRCSGKYLEAQEAVGKVLSEVEAKLKQQEAAGLKSYGALPK